MQALPFHNLNLLYLVRQHRVEGLEILTKTSSRQFRQAINRLAKLGHVRRVDLGNMPSRMLQPLREVFDYFRDPGSDHHQASPASRPLINAISCPKARQVAWMCYGTLFPPSPQCRANSTSRGCRSLPCEKANPIANPVANPSTPAQPLLTNLVQFMSKQSACRLVGHETGAGNVVDQHIQAGHVIMAD